MNIEINISQIREKAIYLIPIDKEEKFIKEFDSEMVYDLMENAEDFLAEGCASYFLNKENGNGNIKQND